MSTNKECRFYPVQCTEETFKGLAAQEGHVYFVTDKKKLFLGKNNEMIPMCANSGIFYGHKIIEYVNDGNKPDPRVTFLTDDIEGDDIPEIDDLILNIGNDEYPDGCFYRVMEVGEGMLVTNRLTLQGTGGGGPSGPSGPSSTNFSISLPNGKNIMVSSQGGVLDVTLQGHYLGEEENYITQVKFIKKGQSEPFYVFNESKPFNKPFSISLVSVMDLFNDHGTTVYMYVYDMYGNERSTDLSISVINLSLTTTESPLLATLSKDKNIYGFRYTINGGIKDGLPFKKVKFRIFNEKHKFGDKDNALLEIEESIDQSFQGSRIKNLDLSSLNHGVYVIEVTAWVSNTIYSNTLTHKIAVQKTDSALLLMGAFGRLEQYTEIPLNYLLVTNKERKNYTLNMKVQGETYPSLTVLSNTIGSYPLYFDKIGEYTIACQIAELGVSNSITLNIEAYTGKIPVIDTQRDDLMLYLSPKGRSNNEVNRHLWQDHNKQYTGIISNAYFNDKSGWLIDENGVPYLNLIAGATFELKDFKPFVKDMTKTSQGGNGFTIELDFEVNGITDFTKSVMSCVSYDRTGLLPQVGFELIGNVMTMSNSRLNNQINPEDNERVGYLSEKTLVEGKRIRLSYVIDPDVYDTSLAKEDQFPICYTYLNGKISGTTVYSSNDSFVDGIIPATLKIDSTYAQVKIYSIRFYNSALRDNDILNNYTASLPTLQEREASFNSNNVYEGTKISLDDIRDNENYDLQIPYMLITGGYPTQSESKWKLIEGGDAFKPALPSAKKDYRMIDVEVVYPKNEYFKDYQDFKYVNEFSNGQFMSQNAGKSADNGGCIMYGQGTSSMEYPVKNLRLRWKKDEYFYKVRPDLANVEIICMKADFMESSGSHNTGAANLIDNLYKNAGMKTPGQEHFGPTAENPDKDTIVTCIKGHPCLIFFSPSGEKGTYEYIGKYNLNLDKATPEPFGFNHDDSNFGYEVDEEGNLVNGEKKNSIFCYEFLDNAAHPVCNFKYGEYTDKHNEGHKVESYEQMWYDTFYHEKDSKYYPGWRMGFESRYPEDEEDTNSADAFYPLASWINDTHYKRMGIGKYSEIGPQEEVALAEFKNNYWKYLDKDFTLAYYLITEALLMVDSRVKNMMIATWGKEWRYLLKDGSIVKEKPEDESKIADSNFGYIWYPIFYDMDTMLGLDNSGHEKFDYDTEDNDPGVYNGDDVLWNLVRDALPMELLNAYKKLELAGLTASKILPFFNSNQANMANEAFYNGDANYKYIRPMREGYTNNLTDKYISPGQAPFMYAVQGDRSLDREYFLDNRMEFLQGKYSSEQFVSDNRIEFRWWTPQPTDEGKLGESATAVPSDGIFDFTSLKTGYAGVVLGANGMIYSERFNDIETKRINVPSESANGTEGYLVGINTLSDLGDLSAKYPEKFVMKTPNNKLKTITLGNTHKKYYNPNWKAGGKITLDAPYLETFNFFNCSSYTEELDFRKNPVIKNIYLTGSGTTGIQLPQNGNLEELRLSSSIKKLEIIGHTSLTADKFSLGPYDYGTGDRIGEEGKGGKYIDDFSQVTDVCIVNTPVDSHKIINESTANLKSYYLPDIDWTINEIEKDKYIIRKADYIYAYDENNNPITLGDSVPANKYYILADATNELYELYSETTYPETFLYERVSMVDENNNIIYIPTLEALSNININLEYANSHAEALTGKITINIPNVSVDELGLYNKYIGIYPELKIQYGSNTNVDQAYRIEFYPDTDVTEHYYYALTKGDNTLHDLINNKEFSLPVKSPTDTVVFEFKGVWQDLADPAHPKYYQDELIGENQEIDDRSRMFSVFKPKANMKLYPIYEESTRPYFIDLYDYNGEYIAEITTNYNTSLKTALREYAYYNYRPDDENLGENERYVLEGWISETDYRNNTLNPTLIDLENTFVLTDKIELYAKYKSENYLENASHPCLFKFKDVSFTDPLTGASVTKVVAVSIVTPDPENPDNNEFNDFRQQINGKITIPSAAPDGRKVIVIEDFANTGLSLKDNSYESTLEFYFLPDSECKYVGASAFKGSDAINIFLPDTIRYIMDNGFQEARKLETVNLNNNIVYIGSFAFASGSQMKVNIEELPLNLEYLGSQAFARSGPNVKCSRIPDKLKELPGYGFWYCPNVTINTLPQRDESCSVGVGAFYDCGQNVNQINIYKPWTFKFTTALDGVKTYQPFHGYGKNIGNVSVNIYGGWDESTYGDPIMTLFGEARTDVTINIVEE